MRKLVGILVLVGILMAVSVYGALPPDIQPCKNLGGITDIKLLCWTTDPLPHTYDGDPRPEYNYLQSCNDIIIANLYVKEGEPDDDNVSCPNNPSETIAQQLYGVPLGDLIAYSIDADGKYVWKSMIGYTNIWYDRNCDGIQDVCEMYTLYIVGDVSSNYEWVDTDENNCANIEITGWDDENKAKFADLIQKPTWTGGRLVEFNQEQWFERLGEDVWQPTVAGVASKFKGKLVPTNDGCGNQDTDKWISARITIDQGNQGVTHPTTIWTVPEFTVFGIAAVAIIIGIYFYKKKKQQ